MEFSTIAGIILITQATPNDQLSKKSSNSACFVIREQSSTDTRMKCNFDLSITDDKTKKYIENYIKENNIISIESIEATWTEGIE